ncbi:ABC transporter ATP-binding protein (plasmid) [Haloimpatiens sp. FM7330]|uniref:ABC transporter ATP-binding protein n=1 Tax=Haloimpatiens sp. FM7330 TaxID=3298610 RepID=UPI003626D480
MDIVKINNATKYYIKKKNKFYANNNISFNIKEGDIVGFLGKNGAGKTTLIKSICNLIKLDSGSICIKDKRIDKNPKVVHDNIGVVLEGARNLYNFLTVDYNLRYFSYLNKINDSQLESRIKKLLEMFELTQKRKEVVNNLSRGMQQKVAIIIAMLKDPDILILDEPTLGLDVVSKTKMKNLLKSLKDKYGKTIIISSHDLDVIENVCNKVVIFEKGKVIKYGSISELKLKESEDRYEIVLKSSEAVNLKDISFEKEEGVIKLETTNLEQIFNRVNTENVIKVEKKVKSLESYLV